MVDEVIKNIKYAAIDILLMTFVLTIILTLVGLIFEGMVGRGEHKELKMRKKRELRSKKEIYVPKYSELKGVENMKRAVDFKRLFPDAIPQKVNINRIGATKFETYWKKGTITKAIINDSVDVTHLVEPEVRVNISKMLNKRLNRFYGQITLIGVYEKNELIKISVRESRTIYLKK